MKPILLCLGENESDWNTLEYVNQYATNIHDDADEEEGETDGELSEVEDFNSDGEDEPAGKLEDV
jgi:hypothetical protein